MSCSEDLDSCVDGYLCTDAGDCEIDPETATTCSDSNECDPNYYCGADGYCEYNFADDAFKYMVLTLVVVGVLCLCFCICLCCCCCRRKKQVVLV